MDREKWLSGQNRRQIGGQQPLAVQFDDRQAAEKKKDQCDGNFAEEPFMFVKGLQWIENIGDPGKKGAHKAGSQSGNRNAALHKGLRESHPLPWGKQVRKWKRAAPATF